MKKFYVLLTLSALSVGLTAMASDPAWWTDSAHSTNFIDTGAASNNYAPLNVGQLKNVAARAKTYLDNQLASVGGAGPTINAMVANLTTNATLNYQPANLGQVKAVAKPFYDRLIAVGYNTTSNLISREYPGNYTGSYPWDPSTPPNQNYSPANLGQLKMVFSFDLNSFVITANLDSNSDGFRDVWQVYESGGTLSNLTTSSDTDGDSTPDYQDADPNSSSTGTLAITIAYPGNGSTL